MKQDNALQVFVPTKDYFGGLYGVFADSLPDKLGNLTNCTGLEERAEEQGRRS